MTKWAHGTLETSTEDNSWSWTQFGGPRAELQTGTPWGETVAQLGEFGWEMIAQQPYIGARDLWFKKQI
jgi:hypothetical protein